MQRQMSKAESAAAAQSASKQAQHVPSRQREEVKRYTTSSDGESASDDNQSKQNQNQSSAAGSDSYDSEEDSDENRSSYESSQSERSYKMPELVCNDYFYSMETQHKDFIRSMVQFGDNILITASEDKTMKVFYFQY